VQHSSAAAFRQYISVKATPIRPGSVSGNTLRLPFSLPLVTQSEESMTSTGSFFYIQVVRPMVGKEPDVKIFGKSK
jgi:hypothetical protein